MLTGSLMFVAGLIVGLGIMLFVYRKNPEEMKAAADAAVEKYKKETNSK